MNELNSLSVFTFYLLSGLLTIVPNAQSAQKICMDSDNSIFWPAITGANTSITFTTLPSFVGAYNLLTAAQCYSSAAAIIVYPSAPPSVAISTDAPANLTICGSTQWNFNLDYTGGDLYQWEVLDPAMGSIVSGNNSPNIEVLFNNPLASSEDVDVIVAVTKCSQTLRDTLTMHVVNIPDYTATPGDTTICAGEELDFTLSPPPLGYSELTWEFGDGTVATQANTSHTYPNNSNVAQYNPVATIVHPGGCLATAIVQAGPISVKPAPVALVSPTGTLTSCGPFSQQLAATVTTGFGSTANYEWFGPAGSNPPNCPTCNTWNINQYGSYNVVVENSYGCQASSNYVIALENCDTSSCPAPLLTNSGSSFIDCGRVQAAIQYSPNGQTITDETWHFPMEAQNTSFTTGTNATATASFEEAGVYTINYLVTANDTCIQKFDQSVYVPFIGDMRYSASCGSGSLYDVTLNDHSNIFPGEVGQIHHSYAYKEGANPWQTITAPGSALSVNVQLPAGDYQLREIIYSNLTPAAPACTTVVNVNLPDKPNADFEIVSPFEPACINDVVVHLNNLSTPAAGLNYLWDFGEEYTNYQPNPDKVFGSLSPSGSFNITLTATNSIGCEDSTQDSIEVHDNDLWDGMSQPTLTTSPTPPVCLGTPVTLSYFSFPIQLPPNYTWYQGSTPITPVVGASDIDVTQGGEYWVMGSDQFGCQVPSESALIHFTQIQTPTVIGNPDQCGDVPFSLTSSTNSMSGVNLSWERNPGGIVGSGNTISQNLPAGIYTYTLTASQNDCEGVSAPFTVTVANPVDTPGISYNILSCQPYVVELTATNAQGGTYNWSNGSAGSTVNGYTGGLFEVYFTANSGCTSSNEISIPKSPQEYIWTFPTGCYCIDELNANNSGVCSGMPVIYHPVIPFAYWSYQVNGVDDLSGTGTVPSAFVNLAPDSINFILDNGNCHITSDAMYLTANCSGGPGIQGLRPGGNSAGSLDTNAGSQNTIQLEPLLRLIPNPATGQTRIQYRYADGEGLKTIEIYDMTGRKIKTFRPDTQSGSISLQLGGFIGGIYEVCLRQDGRITAQSKLSVAP